MATLRVIPRPRVSVAGVKIFLIVLLVAAIALGILGALIEALLWLAFLGLILFAVTVAYWWFRFRRSRSRDIESAS